MDIFEFAIQMERDGQQLYRKLADASKEEGLTKIFTMLADEEAKHERALAHLAAGAATMAGTTILDDSVNVFQQMAAAGDVFDPDTSQIEAYRKAAEVERKSEKFYTEKAGESADDYKTELFTQLAREEHKHLLLMENLVEMLQEPKTWLENAEWNHLEDY